MGAHFVQLSIADLDCISILNDFRCVRLAVTDGWC